MTKEIRAKPLNMLIKIERAFRVHDCHISGRSRLLAAMDAYKPDWLSISGASHQTSSNTQSFWGNKSNGKHAAFLALSIFCSNIPGLASAQGSCNATGANDTPSRVFQDKLPGDGLGPVMIAIKPGSFVMGDRQNVGKSYEKPVHEVTIGHCLSLGKYPVTFAEYDRFTAATGKPLVGDYNWGRDNRPVINVNLSDAQEYTQWLSHQTGHKYRLPSEAEREYAARAGTPSIYPWGDEIGRGNAHCKGCDITPNKKMTAPVGQLPPNPWGLHDMHGNIWELTADCWNYTYDNAPTDGSAWRSGDCTRSVLRGGSWGDIPGDLRSSTRLRSYSGTRTIVIGFRVVRED